MITQIINFLKMDFFELIKKGKSGTKKQKEKSVEQNLDSKILNLDIYNNNFDSDEMKDISNIAGNEFHFLIRREGNIAFKDDFDLSEEAIFELMIPKTKEFEFVYDERNDITGILIDNEIELGYSSEMVGIQVWFDESVTCQKAVGLTQEITQNLIEQTDKKAELWLVFNTSVVSMPF